MSRLSHTFLRAGVAVWTAVIGILWVHDARLGEVIAPKAHAEESTPLATVAELLRRKGFKHTMEPLLCDVFNLKPRCTTYDLATGKDERELLVQANYPTDLTAEAKILADSGENEASILLRTAPTDRRPGKIEYLFLTDIHGRLHGAAVGLYFTVDPKLRPDLRGRLFVEWKATQITPKLEDMFAREIRLWSSEATLKALRNAPDRKD